MAEGGEERRRAAPKENIYSNVTFATMERMLEKIKILDYETSFCTKHHTMPFSRTTFAMPAKNPSVQFQNFLDLTSWLAAEATGDPETFRIDKFDDPNTSVNKMMLALRNLGFSLDFPVAKLKQGHGEATCNVLDFLADKALEARSFTWSAPLHEDAPELEEAEVDEEADLGEIEDEVGVVEEEEVMFTERVADAEVHDVINNEAREMIDGTIDPLQWKTEMERVGPRLKSKPWSLEKEWRSHIEQTKEHEKKIQETLPTAQVHMQNMSTQIQEAVEKMRTREQTMNSEFDGLRAGYEQLRDELKIVETKCSATRTNVNDLTNQMTTVEEANNELKETMNSREISATDTSPLVDIKRALQTIRGDVQTFELQIGVIGHTLMQAKLRQRQAKLANREDGEVSKNDDEEEYDYDDESGYGGGQD